VYEDLMTAHVSPCAQHGFNDLKQKKMPPEGGIEIAER
jgi:hypothetical protein